MKDIVIVNNQLFPSKAALMRHTREKIQTLGHCLIDSGHQEFPFFIDLIKRHSEYKEKAGVGIKKFEITFNPIRKSVNHMNVIRVDDTKVDFSWTYCCNGGIKKKEYLAEAMRASIQDQTSAFYFSQNIIKCENINCLQQHVKKFHVDHRDIPFSELKSKFLEQTNLGVPFLFNDCEVSHKAVFKESDNEFEQEWKEFHKEHATYQILCEKCNCEKGNNVQ